MWICRNIELVYFCNIISTPNGLYNVNICEGAHGVMVIVVGNGHDETSSNPGPS